MPTSRFGSSSTRKYPFSTCWISRTCVQSVVLNKVLILRDQALSIRARRIQAITAESTSLALARPTRRRIVS